MRNTRLRFAAATVALTFVLAIAFGAFGAASNAQVFGASTSLTVISGEVMVRHGAGDFVAATKSAAPWRTITSPERIVSDVLAPKT